MSEIILKGRPAKGSIYPHSVGIRLCENLQTYAMADKIAFVDVESNTTITYRELYEISMKLAIDLKALGFAGKIIGICSENRIEFFIPVIAAFYLGCPIMTISHVYTERELLHACELVKPALIFCSKKAHSLFISLPNKQLKAYLQQLWILENLKNIYEHVEIIESLKPVVVNTKEHIAVLLFSSGTTGLPKAVMITHKNINCLHRYFFDPDHTLGLTDNYLFCLPFSHAYGFHLSLGTLIKGNTGKFMKKFKPVTFLSAIEKYKITFLPLVPPLMVFLAKHPLVDQYNLSSLRTLACGAAVCSKELETCVLNRLGHKLNIYQLYGLTETTLSVVTYHSSEPPRDGSVGKTDSDIEIKFRDPATNKTLGANELGELCARGPLIMKGYYGNPKATKETITSDGWLLTGDLGYCDEDGYIYIVDRLKELIKYKGFQVPPAELEALLLNHPKIMDAAVIGLPDNAAGELPTALVVKKPGIELSEQEVKDSLKGLVSHAKQLHGGVRFVEMIPKSPSGKILRRKLRTLLEKSKL